MKKIQIKSENEILKILVSGAMTYILNSSDPVSKLAKKSL